VGFQKASFRPRQVGVQGGGDVPSYVCTKSLREASALETAWIYADAYVWL
jgi:hypothetical protein